MQQFILFSILISVAVAQPCSIWGPDYYLCIEHGCAFCEANYTRCQIPPTDPLEHCHYGDTVEQPYSLQDGVTYISNSTVYVDYYNGYDNYVFVVKDRKAPITVVVQQIQPGTSVIYMSQKAPQPDPNSWTWAFASQSFTIVGNATKPLSAGPLYFGVANSKSLGYSITVSTSK